ncbi:MAG: hypothetical protein QE263_04585 [Vampirovibrionales bacterium]|nr:hypothetical protein [Vampirovibrionales bacterium]
MTRLKYSFFGHVFCGTVAAAKKTAWVLLLFNPSHAAALRFLKSYYPTGITGIFLKTVSWLTFQKKQPTAYDFNPSDLTLTAFKTALYDFQSGSGFVASQPLLTATYSHAFFSHPTLAEQWDETPLAKHLRGSFKAFPHDLTPQANSQKIFFVTNNNWHFIQPVIEKLAHDPASSYTVKTFEWDAFLQAAEPRLFEVLFSGKATPEALWAIVDDVCPLFRTWYEASDTLVVEWAKSAAIWLSHLHQPGKRLIIRLHSVEAYSYYLYCINWSAVSDFVTVCQHNFDAVNAQRQLSTKHPYLRHWVIKNQQNLEPFSLPKTSNAATTLGLIGYNNANKDPIFALELLAELRHRAPQHPWRLLLVGQPFDDAVVLNQPENWDAKARFTQQIKALTLADAIDYSPYTTDLPPVFTRMGFVLSTSWREGTHETVLQGMASGAIPIVRCWPVVQPFNGAQNQYATAILVNTPTEAATAIINLVEAPDKRHALAAQVMAQSNAQQAEDLHECGWQVLFGASTPSDSRVMLV